MVENVSDNIGNVSRSMKKSGFSPDSSDFSGLGANMAGLWRGFHEHGGAFTNTAGLRRGFRKHGGVLNDFAPNRRAQ